MIHLYFKETYVSLKEPIWKIETTPMEQVMEATPPLFSRAIGSVLLKSL